MNENLKNLLKRISSDEALRAKVEPIAEIEDADAANKALLALAAEAGMPLTAADLEPEEELDLDELGAVVGGAECSCRTSGSGAAGGGVSEFDIFDLDQECTCCNQGEGFFNYSGPFTIHPFVNRRCKCSGNGYGEHMETNRQGEVG